MEIKCIRAGKSKGLTDGKVYKVIDFDMWGYQIKNDLGKIEVYKTNRFEII